MRESTRSVVSQWLPLVGIGGATLFLAAIAEFRSLGGDSPGHPRLGAPSASATGLTRTVELVPLKTTDCSRASSAPLPAVERSGEPLLPSAPGDPRRTEFHPAPLGTDASEPVESQEVSGAAEPPAVGAAPTSADSPTDAGQESASAPNEGSSTDRDPDSAEASAETLPPDPSLGRGSGVPAEDGTGPSEEEESDSVAIEEPPKEIDAAAALLAVARVAGTSVVPDGEPALGQIPIDNEMRKVWRVRTRAMDGGYDRDYLVNAESGDVIRSSERKFASEAPGGVTIEPEADAVAMTSSHIFAAASNGDELLPEVQYHFANESLYHAYETRRSDGLTPDELPDGMKVVLEEDRDAFDPHPVVRKTFLLVDVSRDFRIVTGVNSKPGLRSDELYFGRIARVVSFGRPFISALSMSAGRTVWTAPNVQFLLPHPLDRNVVQAHIAMGRVVDYWMRTFERNGIAGSTDPGDIYIGVGGLVEGRPNKFATYNNWIVFGQPDGRPRVSCTSLEDVAAAYACAIVDRQHGPSSDYEQSAALRAHLASAFAVFTSFHARTDDRHAPGENSDDTTLWQLVERDYVTLPGGANFDVFASPVVSHVDRYVPRGNPTVNSGILNQALYLIVHGGTNPVSGKHVDGLTSLFSGDRNRAFGLVEHAYYRLLTSDDLAIRLNWSSGYRDFRDQFLAALAQEFSAQFAQVNEDQRAQVWALIDQEARQAFLAVGVE